MILFKNFRNIFFIPELRSKLLFTLGTLVVFRLGSFIPLVGIDIAKLAAGMQKAGILTGILGYLDVFSGGSLTKATIFALGIGPYITASIMMQILSIGVPEFERLVKEGEYGRQMINQYSRYLALGLSVFYSLSYALVLERQGYALTPGWAFRFTTVVSLTVGSMFVMWLGDQISLFGLGGSGSSILIFAGIVAHFPEYVLKTWQLVSLNSLQSWEALLILCVFIAVTICVIFLEKGERKIPVQYPRRIVGQRMYGGQSTYIPFKINTAGVMPAIFSQSVLQLPLMILTALSERGWIFKKGLEFMNPSWFLFNALQFMLIIFFSYAYTALIYDPEKLADDIKKSGGIIVPFRPGRQTAEFFNFMLTRLNLVGGLYLGSLVLFPTILNLILRMPFYLTGTSLLIVVGVALDTAAQIESYLIEHRYEGFLSTGRLKTGVGR